MGNLHYVIRRCGLPPTFGPSDHTLALKAEYDQAICRAQKLKARAWREQQGWPPRATLMGLGGGLARIVFVRDGTYEPVDCEGIGTPAIILQAWNGPAPGRPENLLDLVAWVPSTGVLLPRRGLVDVLGEWAIAMAEPIGGDGGHPLRVFTDPRQWAIAATWDGPYCKGAHGILVVNWSGVKAILGHLVGVVPFIADNLDTAHKLRKALAPTIPPMAQILVTTGGRLVA